MTKREIKRQMEMNIRFIQRDKAHIEFCETRIKTLSDQLVKLENKEPAGFARDIEEIKETPF